MPEWKPEIGLRLAGVELGPVREAAVVEELAQYLDDHYAELLAGGATEAEAYQQTLAELSGSELLAHELQRAERQVAPDPIAPGTNRGTNMFADLWQDLRYGARMLLRSPIFTGVAALTLALGIGGNTTIFTLFYSVALRPLPVKDPASVVNVYQSYTGSYSRRVSGNRYLLSYPEYLNYRDQSRVFSGLAAYVGTSLTLSGGETESVSGSLVSDNYFSVLGSEAALGRLLVPNECQTAGDCPRAVLSWGFWQRRFGGDPDLIGKTLTLNRRPFTVVGIAAREFRGADFVAPDVWLPLIMRDELTAGDDFLPLRDCGWLYIAGRLKPGVALKQAQAEMSLVANHSDRNGAVTEYPERKTNVIVAPGAFLNSPEAYEKGAPLAALLMAAVGLVLLIACANVSNMLLARAVTRQKEVGVRLALGASRGRLVRQLLTESLLLALLSGAGGLALAFWLPPVLLLSLDRSLNFDLSPNLTVFGYCFLVSFGAGIVFGLAPALNATKLDLISTLKAEGAMISPRFSRSRLRNLLVVIQVAVSLLLLIGAGFLARGLHRAQSTDLGFDPGNALSLSVDLASAGYDAPRAAIFYQRLTERLTALPGGQSVSFAQNIPLAGVNVTTIKLEGERALQVNSNTVSPQYFRTLGIPIIRGRCFNEQDVKSRRQVVVISQAMAQRFWPGEDPIGKRFNSDHEIIGVARDISSTRLGEPDGPFFYEPAFIEKQMGGKILLRTGVKGQATLMAARDVARSLDRNVVVSVRRLEEHLENILRPARFGAMFSIALGVFALALSTVGVYGVMAYSVGQRTREIGIRVTLGAQAVDVLRLVIRQGLRLVAIGIGIGLGIALPLAFAASRIFPQALFGLSPLDPMTFVCVSLFLAATASLACYIPARLATKVDPLVALRCD
ncbi:MAG TPA: ABC transporter permease [Blastocatellia bacterium]